MEDTEGGRVVEGSMCEIWRADEEEEVVVLRIAYDVEDRDLLPRWRCRGTFSCSIR